MQHKKLNTNTVVIDGVSINYWQRNEQATQKVVLALHGFMSDLRSIQPFVNDLKVDDDTRVLLPDLPGFGASEPLNHDPTVDDYVVWAHNFLHKVTPKAKEVTIVGYSFGAYIAIKF